MRRIFSLPFTSAYLCCRSPGLCTGPPWLTPAALPKPKPSKTAASETPHYGNADSITQDELKIYLYFLASDQLEGRNLPSRGFDTAALYVASHLAEWGLKPGGSSTNTLGPLEPYFMPMELVAKTVIPADTKASITEPESGRGGGRGGGRGNPQAANEPAAPRAVDLEYGKDWTINSAGRGAAPLESVELDANMVFVGNGYTVEEDENRPLCGARLERQNRRSCRLAS